jgi:hypothetical protein
MLLGRKKSKGSFELPVVQEDLAMKLAAELRTCVTCGYSVTNPMTDRCPRCFAAIALSEHTNCGDCSHQGACEFQKLHAMKQK